MSVVRDPSTPQWAELELHGHALLDSIRLALEAVARAEIALDDRLIDVLRVTLDAAWAKFELANELKAHLAAQAA